MPFFHDDGMKDIEIKKGESFTFDVPFEAEPDPKIIWKTQTGFPSNWNSPVPSHHLFMINDFGDWIKSEQNSEKEINENGKRISITNSR